MRTRLSICQRKVRYASGHEAHLAIDRATIALRPYRCDRCGMFHLTSRTKGKRVPRPPVSQVTDPHQSGRSRLDWVAAHI